MGSMNMSLMGSLSWIILSLMFMVGSCAKPSGPATDISKNLCFPNFMLHHGEIKLLGSAKIEENHGIIQIPDAKSDLARQAGRAICSSPIRLLDPYTGTPASFNTTFSFQIQNPGAEDRGASGLTFIIVPDEVTVGRPGKWLGMLNDACDEDYKAFAVEFDTYKNEEFGDPNDNHVGINLGSIVSSTTIDAALAGVTISDGSVVRAGINYDGGRKWIDLHLGREATMRPLYSAPLDLTPFLREYMFVGFSASTGNLSQVHNIISWNFSSVSPAHLRLPSDESCENKIFVEGYRAPLVKKRAPDAFLIFVAVVFLCLIALLNLCCNGKFSSKEQEVAPPKTQRPRPPNKSRRFTLAEVSVATRCFSEVEFLGQGCRGAFYRGTLQTGCNVAIKRLSPQCLHPGVDRRKILKEIAALSRIRHPKIVPMRGWSCGSSGAKQQELMLIYDYMPNGSLDKWLFAPGVLPWTRRYKLLIDVAEALAFLHQKKLVHKSVKTSNILLDLTFRGVVGDFGLWYFASSVKNQQALVPPEMGYTDQATDKYDVFGFGIVVLEMVVGRRCVRKQGKGGLLEWVWGLHEDKRVEEAVDKRLSVYNSEQAQRALEIGLMCTMEDPKTRPSMEEVVGYMNPEAPGPPLPPFRPPVLFSYPSATNVCSLQSCAPLALGRSTFTIHTRK
ncbi:L-type lectin-domain containing receptor kinase VIII.2 [Amborella trichopoda]|uniref:Protein kinase domain-containing protein n=1 Tax=Amborella trichopoda TaxID=13333 RepID=W1P6Z1_AMBTC|nr:L-type lectin-domain containing receptor kinase VIII.2 [Amborella trichopoda]ERN03678.1 hypothetical protein AMTR_s00144p00086790 [Amborella trichopoda]|eukprot:XP_006842003.1 L-type lectin-domain containing receptor kinase VIII.2 [Amborella trichopoda]